MSHLKLLVKTKAIFKFVAQKYSTGVKLFPNFSKSPQHGVHAAGVIRGEIKGFSPMESWRELACSVENGVKEVVLGFK